MLKVTNIMSMEYVVTIVTTLQAEFGLAIGDWCY